MRGQHQLTRKGWCFCYRDVALVQFSPCVWMIGLECMHICCVAWPESLVFEPIHGREVDFADFMSLGTI